MMACLSFELSISFWIGKGCSMLLYVGDRIEDHVKVREFDLGRVKWLRSCSGGDFSFSYGVYMNFNLSVAFCVNWCWNLIEID